MDKFTNNLYDSEVNTDDSTLGLAQFGGGDNLMKQFYKNSMTSFSDASSSIGESAQELGNNTINTAVNIVKSGIDFADKVKNIVVDGVDHFINGNDDKLKSIDPMMSINQQQPPQQPITTPTPSSRIETFNKKGDDGEATVSLYNNLNNIVKEGGCNYKKGGCDCNKRYCGGDDDFSTENIMNEVNNITGGCGECNKQLVGGDDDEYFDIESDSEIDDLDDNMDDDDEDIEMTGGAKKTNGGFSDFINNLYGECMKGGRRRRFNPEAIEWNKKSNEYIQNELKITDWDDIKAIKYIINSKNKKSIGEDKLKEMSDVERAKLLYDELIKLTDKDIKKINFDKIKKERISKIKEKYGDKYREPKPKENSDSSTIKEEKKSKTKSKSKKGGNLFLDDEDDEESIQLPGNFKM